MGFTVEHKGSDGKWHPGFPPGLKVPQGGFARRLLNPFRPPFYVLFLFVALAANFFFPYAKYALPFGQNVPVSEIPYLVNVSCNPGDVGQVTLLTAEKIFDSYQLQFAIAAPNGRDMRWANTIRRERLPSPTGGLPLVGIKKNGELLLKEQQAAVGSAYVYDRGQYVGDCVVEVRPKASQSTSVG